VDDVCRVACVTSSSIDCGVQLLADYGQAYWTGAGLSPIQLK